MDPNVAKIAALEARIAQLQALILSAGTTTDALERHVAELQASRNEFELLLLDERQRHATTLAALNELQNPSSCQGGYIALTFDDGPNAETSNKLDALRAAGLKATFFVLGQQVAQYPDVARRIIAEGHHIGNHSFTHASLATLTREMIDWEIQQTQQIVFAVTGYTPQFVRPPMGETNALVKERIQAAGLREVLWTHDTFDWLPYTVRELSFSDGTLIPGNEPWVGQFRTWDAVLRRIMNVQPNGIVLMHDALTSSTQMLPHLADYWSRTLTGTPICSGRIVPTTNVMPNQDWWDPAQLMHVKAGPWQ